jgi:hypothetical protein
MKKYLLSRKFSMLSRLLSMGVIAISNRGEAVNIKVDKGWPCNVFIQQPGVDDAPGNYADFNAKPTPAAPSFLYRFIAGEDANHLTNLGLDFNRNLNELPVLEPLGFYFKSERFGAKFGVDVCIPVINATREDVIPWTATITGLGPLLTSPDADWFGQANPKVSLQIIASNCNGAVGSPMSSAAPLVPGACEFTSSPLPGADTLSGLGLPLEYAFNLIASREAVLRLTVEEQSLLPRLNAIASGQIQVEFTDPPLPPLLVGDLLGKQLFYAPDPNLIDWPGCANFTVRSGMAFSEMNLQGPNNSLELRWTGKDTDCASSGTCADGNKRANNFTFPVTVYLENGSVAPPTASASDKVKGFEGLFSDTVASGETAFPSDGKITFDAVLDEVYRDSGKPFFSTTVSRLVGPGQWRQCRVWFKRDNGFNCSTLPTAALQLLCQSMS